MKLENNIKIKSRNQLSWLNLDIEGAKQWRLQILKSQTLYF